MSWPHVGYAYALADRLSCLARCAFARLIAARLIPRVLLTRVPRVPVSGLWCGAAIPGGRYTPVLYDERPLVQTSGSRLPFFSTIRLTKSESYRETLGAERGTRNVVYASIHLVQGPG